MTFDSFADSERRMASRYVSDCKLFPVKSIFDIDTSPVVRDSIDLVAVGEATNKPSPLRALSTPSAEEDGAPHLFSLDSKFSSAGVNLTLTLPSTPMDQKVRKQSIDVQQAEEDEEESSQESTSPQISRDASLESPQASTETHESSTSLESEEDRFTIPPVTKEEIRDASVRKKMSGMLSQIFSRVDDKSDRRKIAVGRGRSASVQIDRMPPPHPANGHLTASSNGASMIRQRSKSLKPQSRPLPPLPAHENFGAVRMRHSHSSSASHVVGALGLNNAPSVPRKNSDSQKPQNDALPSLPAIQSFNEVRMSFTASAVHNDFVKKGPLEKPQRPRSSQVIENPDLLFCSQANDPPQRANPTHTFQQSQPSQVPPVNRKDEQPDGSRADVRPPQSLQSDGGERSSPTHLRGESKDSTDGACAVSNKESDKPVPAPAEDNQMKGIVPSASMRQRRPLPPRPLIDLGIDVTKQSTFADFVADDSSKSSIRKIRKIRSLGDIWLLAKAHTSKPKTGPAGNPPVLCVSPKLSTESIMPRSERVKTLGTTNVQPRLRHRFTNSVPFVSHSRESSESGVTWIGRKKRRRGFSLAAIFRGKSEEQSQPRERVGIRYAEAAVQTEEPVPAVPPIPKKYLPEPRSKDASTVPASTSNTAPIVPVIVEPAAEEGGSSGKQERQSASPARMQAMKKLESAAMKQVAEEDSSDDSLRSLNVGQVRSRISTWNEGEFADLAGVVELREEETICGADQEAERKGRVMAKASKEKSSSSLAVSGEPVSSTRQTDIVPKLHAFLPPGGNRRASGISSWYLSETQEIIMNNFVPSMDDENPKSRTTIVDDDKTTARATRLDGDKPTPGGATTVESLPISVRSLGASSPTTGETTQQEAEMMASSDSGSSYGKASSESSETLSSLVSAIIRTPLEGCPPLPHVEDASGEDSVYSDAQLAQSAEADSLKSQQKSSKAHQDTKQPVTVTEEVSSGIPPNGDKVPSSSTAIGSTENFDPETPTQVYNPGPVSSSAQSQLKTMRNVVQFHKPLPPFANHAAVETRTPPLSSQGSSTSESSLLNADFPYPPIKKLLLVEAQTQGQARFSIASSHRQSRSMSLSPLVPYNVNGNGAEGGARRASHGQVLNYTKSGSRRAVASALPQRKSSLQPLSSAACIGVQNKKLDWI